MAIEKLKYFFITVIDKVACPFNFIHVSSGKLKEILIEPKTYIFIPCHIDQQRCDGMISEDDIMSDHIIMTVSTQYTSSIVK